MSSDPRGSGPPGTTTLPGHGAAPTTPHPAAEPTTPFSPVMGPSPFAAPPAGAPPAPAYPLGPQRPHSASQPMGPGPAPQSPSPHAPPPAQPYPPAAAPPYAPPAHGYPPTAPYAPPPAQPYPPAAAPPYAPPAPAYPPTAPYAPPAHAPPPAQPYPAPAQPYPPPPQQQPPPPHAPLPGGVEQHAPRRPTQLVATVAAPSGHGLGALIAVSFRRAFRLRIEPNEVLDDERAAMAAAQPAITDPTQQAFMAWRRSVLMMAALLMIPVALLHAIEGLDFEPYMPGGWKALAVIGVLVEAGFAALLWSQLPRWTRWRPQARVLSIGWLVYFLTPFLLFLYPLASSIDYLGAAGAAGADIHALGPEAQAQLQQMRVMVGIGVGGQALLTLAPKIIALLQGLIRASIATKTLFPGATAPGWLMVLAAPLYIIVFYVFVLLPYHFSGSGLFVLGMILVVAAKLSLVRAGLGLARPLRPDAARAATARTLAVWLALLAGGIGMIVLGLWDALAQLGAADLFKFVLSIAANILVLTLICTDLLITGLDRARGESAEEAALADEATVQVGAFTGT
ncbi:MAG: hypothetical protein R2939_14450 [Kofleriaceae bacterium]